MHFHRHKQLHCMHCAHNWTTHVFPTIKMCTRAAFSAGRGREGQTKTFQDVAVDKGVRCRGGKGLNMYYTISTFQKSRGARAPGFPPPLNAALSTIIPFLRCKNIFVCEKCPKTFFMNIIIQRTCTSVYTHYNTPKLKKCSLQFNLHKSYFTQTFLAWKFTRWKNELQYFSIAHVSTSTLYAPVYSMEKVMHNFGMLLPSKNTVVVELWIRIN